MRIAGESRYIPVEYAAATAMRLGTPLPPGLAEVFLESSSDPLCGNHSPLRPHARSIHHRRNRGALRSQPAGRSKRCCALCIGSGKLLEGEFRPGGTHREWCDPEVLQQIRRKSLARLRREIEPVEQRTFVRFATRWQGVTVPRRGLDALLDAIENLQGAALLASELEREILPARIADYRPGDLDALMAAGEVVWVGVEQVGDRDGRIALYLSGIAAASLACRRSCDSAQSLRTNRALAEKAIVLEFLAQSGASFFVANSSAWAAVSPAKPLTPCGNWSGSGHITNDTFIPLRELLRRTRRRARSKARMAEAPPGSPDFLRRLRSRQPRPGAGPLVADPPAAWRCSDDNHAVERQRRAAAAGAPRHRDARDGDRRKYSAAATARFIPR